MPSLTDILVTGIIAVIAVYLYNDFVAGTKVAGMTLGRA